MDSLWKQQLIKAKTEIFELQKSFPAETLLVSATRQLDYLIEVAEGRADDSQLETISLGRLAVYPLADILPDDLSSLLCSISQSVKRELKGLGRKSQF